MVVINGRLVVADEVPIATRGPLLTLPGLLRQRPSCTKATSFQYCPLLYRPASIIFLAVLQRCGLRLAILKPSSDYRSVTVPIKLRKLSRLMILEQSRKSRERLAAQSGGGLSDHFYFKTGGSGGNDSRLTWKGHSLLPI